MTAPSSRAPTHLQPRLKSVATSDTSSQSASANPNSSPSTALPSTQLPKASRLALQDAVSDKATIALIRRTLSPSSADKNAQIFETLPPLTSRNDVDLQVYALVAIVIKEFVQTWYSKITPDQTFVEEVIRILAHCTTGLEQRLRKVDLEALLFDELPELLDAHVQAYRASHYPLHPLLYEANARDVYHSLWPSPALSPVPDKSNPESVLLQKENEAAYRELLIQGVLAVLLPTEDYKNDCLTSLIGAILSDMIIGNGIGGKACEPWLIWEGIGKITEVVQNQMPKAKAQVRAEKSITLLGDSREQETKLAPNRSASRWSIQKTFWLVLQYAFLTFTTIRFIIVTIATSSSLPSRSSRFVKNPDSSPVRNGLEPPDSSGSRHDSRSRISSVKQPILDMKIWSCASNLMEVDIRMPWLSATISMLQWFSLYGPGQIGYTDGMLDKLLSHTIATKILNPIHLPLLLRNVRAALFPNNAPAPPQIVPSAAEALGIRRTCAEKICGLVPEKVRAVYFGSSLTFTTETKATKSGGEDEKADTILGIDKQRKRAQAEERQVREVEEMLDVFSDAYCNKHFMYTLIDLVIVRLFPELAEKGVMALREERLG